ncbi:hypothetical protein [Salinibacterium sp.]|uniref:hypothetical protein n=1 Tax=Salinibacterium sp. TaxID=1915057 RepID=UPI00286B6D1F|nr:hypothetical protein [Salinibacterium sp.]
MPSAPAAVVTPSPTATAPTPTATPTPTPTVVAPTKPALAELVLTADGLGPLLMGQAPPVTDPALDILVFDPEHCDAGQGDPGLWVPNYDDPAAFYTTIDDQGLVSQLALFRRSDSADTGVGPILTDTGIGVGSTRDELLAAHPTGFDEIVTTGQVSDVYIASGNTGSLVFEVAKNDNLPGYWGSDQLGVVQLIRTAQAGGSVGSYLASDRPLGERCPGGL